MNLNAPEAILFDLDGTLLDTARDLGNALNHLLEQQGRPTCTYEQFRPIASHGAKGLLELGFGDLLNAENFAELRKVFLEFYNQNICVDTCLFEGVSTLLNELDNQRMPWGIVTNKPGGLTRSLLPNFEELATCGVMVSGDCLEKRKPDPEPLLHAADQLGIDPDRIWYVGDAERDIEAANAAGMISVIADYGYISESDKPDQWQADLRINKADHLVKLIF